MAQVKQAIDWSEQLAAAVEKAAPSVLRVARRRRGASATVWDAAAGLVVTTHHAAAGEDAVELVDEGGRMRQATVVGTDPGTDLALLKVDPDGLVAPEVREVDGLKVGHAALALGRPGRGVRASLRIVGVLAGEVRTPWGGRLERYVETDRGFPRGFSGGPLVDLDGRVIGIDTAALLRGADVTVPAVTVRRVVEELLRHGAVRRGHLGVAVQRVRLPAPASAALGGQASAALVVRVEEGSPAAAAGIVLGDVIVAVDGAVVGGADDVREAIAERGGEEVEVRVLRVGALETLRATVGEQ